MRFLLRTKFISIVAMLSIVFITSTMRSFETHELLAAYDFVEGFDEPEHLTQLNGTAHMRAHSILYSIDSVHRQGLIHIGSWIWIEDIQGKVLVLKRSPTLVTCPNSYSLVGEHASRFEQPNATWLRAIREELGQAMLSHIKYAQELPGSPIYYARDYGTKNSNRVDRQLTYLWWVKMDSAGAELPIKPDAEIALHEWIETKTLQGWLEEAHENLAKTTGVGSRLCHKTIVTLWETVLRGVQEVNPTETTN